jgi:hypothetical protein
VTTAPDNQSVLYLQSIDLIVERVPVNCHRRKKKKIDEPSSYSGNERNQLPAALSKAMQIRALQIC